MHIKQISYKAYLFESGFFNLHTIGILSQTITCYGETGLCIVNVQLHPWLVPSRCPLQAPLPSPHQGVTIKKVSRYFQMSPGYKTTPS